MSNFLNSFIRWILRILERTYSASIWFFPVYIYSSLSVDGYPDTADSKPAQYWGHLHGLRQEHRQLLSETLVVPIGFSNSPICAAIALIQSTLLLTEIFPTTIRRHIVSL